MCLGVFSSSFMLPWVRWSSCICRLLFGSNLKIFQSTFLQIFFFPILSFFSFWDPNYMYVLLFDTVIFASEPLFILLSHLSLYILVWIISVDSLSCLLIPLLCSLLLITCNECLISDIVSFQFYIFHLSLLHNSIALLKFSTCTNFIQTSLYFL